jgi:hypothetical protein
MEKNLQGKLVLNYLPSFPPSLPHRLLLKGMEEVTFPPSKAFA